MTTLVDAALSYEGRHISKVGVMATTEVTVLSISLGYRVMSARVLSCVIIKCLPSHDLKNSLCL